MKLLKHTVLALGLVSSLACSMAAWAQWSPTKPIRLIMPYNPGGSGDITMRILLDRLTAALGQPLVNDYRGGAGGVIGTEAGAKAAPDGYNLVFGSDAPFTIIPHLQKVPYNPLKDFEHVSLIASLPLVLVVHPSVPAKNLQELIALAKSKPGQMTVGSNGNGSSGHLASELLKSEAKIDIVHVPYKGQAQVVTDLVGGQVNMVFSSVGPVEQHVKAGKLRAIAVTTPNRFAGMAGVPTMAESGLPQFTIGVWLGILAPLGTPKPVLARINAEMSKVLAVPEVRERFATLGYEAVGGDASLLRDRIESDYQKWGKLIRDANIKGD